AVFWAVFVIPTVVLFVSATALGIWAAKSIQTTTQFIFNATRKYALILARAGLLIATINVAISVIFAIIYSVLFRLRPEIFTISPDSTQEARAVPVLLFFQYAMFNFL